jgi:signal transduction histidine kinase
MTAGQSLNFTEYLVGLLHELMFTRDILKSLHVRGGTGQNQTTSLCTLVAQALEQLAPLAQLLQKELPECHGLDLLQSHTLHLTPELAYLLRGALNHIVTNIMDHGFETREERVRKGKPVRGAIAFHLFETPQNWALQISDDGRGLPRQALEDKLKKLGREIPKDPEALAQVLLEGGFSTKDTVSDLSGRGLGLDAVAAAFEKFGGTFRITTRARTRDAEPQLVFTLELPKTAFGSSDHTSAVA